MKNFFGKIWDFLSGKKTVAGAALLIAGTAIPYVPAAVALAPAVPYLLGVGTMMGGAGIFHKVYKAGQDASPIIAVLPPLSGSHLEQIRVAMVAATTPVQLVTPMVETPVVVLNPPA